MRVWAWVFLNCLKIDFGPVQRGYGTFGQGTGYSATRQTVDDANDIKIFGLKQTDRRVISMRLNCWGEKTFKLPFYLRVACHHARNTDDRLCFSCSLICVTNIYKWTWQLHVKFSLDVEIALCRETIHWVIKTMRTAVARCGAREPFG